MIFPFQSHISMSVLYFPIMSFIFILNLSLIFVSHLIFTYHCPYIYVMSLNFFAGHSFQDSEQGMGTFLQARIPLSVCKQYHAVMVSLQTLQIQKIVVLRKKNTHNSDSCIIAKPTINVAYSPIQDSDHPWHSAQSDQSLVALILGSP